MISGTPADGSGGVYVLEFQLYPSKRARFRTAKLTLTVNEGPSFLSANKVTPPLTFNTGTAASFRSERPRLPVSGLEHHWEISAGSCIQPRDRHISGHGPARPRRSVQCRTHGPKRIWLFRARTVTIVVNDAAVITSVATTTFTIGQDNVFLITATGYPSPKFSWSSASSLHPG